MQETHKSAANSHQLAGFNCAVPRAHTNPTSAWGRTGTLAPPLPDGGVQPMHTYANSQDQCLWALSARQLQRGTTQQVGTLTHQAQVNSLGSYC